MNIEGGKASSKYEEKSDFNRVVRW